MFYISTRSGEVLIKTYLTLLLRGQTILKMLIQNLSHHNCIPAIERMETKYSYSYDTNQSQLAIGMAFQLQQTAVYRPRISENHSQNFPCLIGKFGLRVWNKYIERTQFIMRLSTRKVFRSYNVRGLSFHSFRRLHFVN